MFCLRRKLLNDDTPLQQGIAANYITPDYYKNYRLKPQKNEQPPRKEIARFFNSRKSDAASKFLTHPAPFNHPTPDNSPQKRHRSRPPISISKSRGSCPASPGTGYNCPLHSPFYSFPSRRSIPSLWLCL